MTDTDRREAISRQARAWLGVNALILDTETTGLDEHAEIVEIAVIDCTGAVLLDTLVRPAGPIPAEAVEIHGITNEMVAGAPAWADVHRTFCELTEGRPIVVYNAPYDRRVLCQTMRRYGLPVPPELEAADEDAQVQCAMLAYAEYWGEWDVKRETWCWQKLSAAATQQGVELDAPAHRARADCMMTLGVIMAMAVE
jgi:DNA polymerase-3 subunit epsilon